MKTIDNNKDGIMKSINELTLYDLMSEEYQIWISKNNKFGFDLTINGENGNVIADEKGIHRFAIEGFAEFCRDYLYCYERAMKQEAA